MPLQNRVDPFGDLHSVSARWNLLGNRGVLHDQQSNIVNPWKSKARVTCVLEYCGYQRALFEPGKYSQLFFLDEATAFASGHRLCGACCSQRYREFRSKWLNANREAVTSDKVSITEIDKYLHAERAVSGGTKVTFEVRVDSLPFGVIIEGEGNAYLMTEMALLP